MSRRQLGLVVATSLAVASGAHAADIRMLSSWDKTNPAVAALADSFAKGVETATNGNTKFIMSGPETVPPFEQLQPLSTGVFQNLFTHAIYHYGHHRHRRRHGRGARRSGGAPQVRHDRGDGQALPEARTQGRRGRDLGNERLPHRAACAGRPLRRFAGTEDPRHTELSHGYRHARRIPCRVT